MIMGALILLCIGIAIYLFIKAENKKEASRDATFRATMLALEEKAKREGTYVVSYFDSETNKNS